MIVPHEDLPAFADHEFRAWLDKELARMNRRIARWKDHLEQKQAYYEWKNACLWRRCIKEAAEYEVKSTELDKRVEDAIDILGRALASGHIYASTYQAVLDALRKEDKHGD